MGIFSAIGRFFSKLFAWLKKILKWLLPLLVVALIVCAIFFPAVLPAISSWVTGAWNWISTSIGSWASTLWGWIKTGASFVWDKAAKWIADASFTDLLKVAAGTALLVDPKGTVNWVKDVITDVGSGIGDALGSVASNFLPLLIGGVVLWFLFTKSSDSERDIVVQTSPQGYGGAPND